MLRIVAVAITLRLSLGLLSPEFHETLLCPAQHCLARKHTALGFGGPKRAFFTCSSPKSTVAPIAWVLTDGEDVMSRFLSGGYHSRRCFNEGLAPEE